MSQVIRSSCFHMLVCNSRLDASNGVLKIVPLLNLRQNQPVAAGLVFQLNDKIVFALRKKTDV